MSRTQEQQKGQPARTAGLSEKAAEATQALQLVCWDLLGAVEQAVFVLESESQELSGEAGRAVAFHAESLERYGGMLEKALESYKENAHNEVVQSIPVTPARLEVTP